MPMQPPDELARAVHDSGRRVVMAITGGGTGAIAALCGVPGASRSVLEAVVPYSQRALEELLGGVPAQACSEPTARRLAVAAWRRASELDGSDARALVGVGVTASLATDRPKRGEHRLHAATHSAERTAVMTLTLEKGRRTRGEEEGVAAHATLAMLADESGARTIDLSKTPPGVVASHFAAPAPAEWTRLWLGEVDRAWADGPGVDPIGLLIPGSFDPPHEGHAELARVAERLTGRPAAWELSVTNVDKPPLDFVDLSRRTAALAPRPVLLTRAPTFVEKARVAPGCIFAVGADTAERIGRSRYYSDDRARDRAIDEITARGCRFLVFGRAEGDRFRELADLELPAGLRAVCDGVPEREFRRDVSSTELRRAAAREPS